MKKTFTIIFLLAAMFAQAQVFDFIKTGEYAITTNNLGTTDRVEKSPRNYYTYTGTGALIGDTVFYVPATAPNDTILTLINRRPPKKRAAILIERGSIRIITITIPKDSIIIGSYGSGAKPKIYGSQVITGWLSAGTNVWRAKPGAVVNQVFVNGRKFGLAKYSATYEPITTVTSQNNITLSGLYSGATDYYKGCVAMTRTQNWLRHMVNITASTGNTLTISSVAEGTLQTGQGILIMGKREFVDSPYEFFYNSTTDSLYIYSTVNPNTLEVRGSTTASGIIVGVKNYVTIKNLEFLHQANNAVSISGNDTSRYVNVNNCSFTGQYKFGVYCEPTRSRFLTVENSSFTNIGASAIYGLNTVNATIRNNTIRKIGMINETGANGVDAYAKGSGIHITRNTSTGINTIEYNYIDSTCYNGIRFAGLANVRYNYVRNSQLHSGDGGGIYTEVSSGGNISYNIVENSEGSVEGRPAGIATDGNGVYVDEPASSGSTGYNVLVEYNTALSNQGYGFFTHRSENVTLRNNTSFNNRAALLVAGSSGTVASSYTNNLLIANSSTYKYSPFRQYLTDTRNSFSNHTVNATINNNLYVNPFTAVNDKSFSDRIERKDLQSYAWSGNVIEITVGAHRYTAGNEVTISNATGTATINGIYAIASVTGTTIRLNKTGSGTSGTCSITSGEFLVNLATFRTLTTYDANSTLNSTSLNANETQRVIYNASIVPVTYYLNNAQSVKDSANAAINASFSLGAYRSKYVRAINPQFIQPYSDAIAPTMTAFSVPSTVNGLIIPINSFTTSADAAAYLITESALTPALTLAGWSSVKPTNYTVTSSGAKTLYAWCRDAAGNVSNSISSVTTATFNVTELTRKLIAAYDLEETSVLAQDAGSNALHASSHQAGVTINQTGNPGKSYSFSGALWSTNNVVVNDNNPLSFTDTMTVVVWLKLASINRGHTILYKGGTNNYEYLFSVGSDNKLRWYIYQNGTATTMLVTGSTILAANTDYMIEFSTSNVLARSAMKILINGVEETLTGSNNSTITNLLNGTSPLWLGGDSQLGMALNGNLSQVLMFGKLLSTEQRSYLYNAGNGRNKANW